jgi:hypothetical protein
MIYGFLESLLAFFFWHWHDIEAKDFHTLLVGSFLFDLSYWRSHKQFLHENSQ